MDNAAAAAEKGRAKRKRRRDAAKLRKAQALPAEHITATARRRNRRKRFKGDSHLAGRAAALDNTHPCGDEALDNTQPCVGLWGTVRQDRVPPPVILSADCTLWSNVLRKVDRKMATSAAAAAPTDEKTAPTNEKAGHAARDIRIFPNKEAKATLRHWYADYCKVYNACVEIQNSREWQQGWAQRSMQAAEKWVDQIAAEMAKARGAVRAAEEALRDARINRRRISSRRRDG
jgi:hypothetical protein